MGFDETMERADVAALSEMGRSAGSAVAVKIAGTPVLASVSEIGADSKPADFGNIIGALAQIVISSDDFSNFAVKVGTKVTVPGAVAEDLLVLGVRGSGLVRTLICGAQGAGRQSEF
jgi:uncharacterized protein (DUF2342 family)